MIAMPNTGTAEAQDNARNAQKKNRRRTGAEPETPIERLINPVYFALDDYRVSFDDKLRLNKLAKRLKPALKIASKSAY